MRTAAITNATVVRTRRLILLALVAEADFSVLREGDCAVCSENSRVRKERLTRTFFTSIIFCPSISGHHPAGTLQGPPRTNVCNARFKTRLVRKCAKCIPAGVGEDASHVMREPSSRQACEHGDVEDAMHAGLQPRYNLRPTPNTEPTCTAAVVKARCVHTQRRGSVEASS